MRLPDEVDPTFPSSPTLVQAERAADDYDLGWTHAWPSHIVLFDALFRQHAGVEQYLAERGYKEAWRSWNSHFQDDARREGDVIVLQYQKRY